METQKCIECGREKTLNSFIFTRWGKYSNVCRECTAAKQRETRASKRPKIGEGKLSDPEFDGKDPVEVIQLMGRAKRWLESRGYIIHLEGEIKKTHKVKFS